ncbi:hypothetical protein FB107DRAFT_222297 [Schizophyllum commune]
MTSPGDTSSSSSSSSNPTHPTTTATTRRRSDSPDYPASKKRRRTFTADDRAQHRVIEKQRREALNEKFIDLARLLPNLAHVRRLSKGLIVDASIAHHKRQRAQRWLAAQEVRLLLEEREGLYKEVEALRVKLKEPPADPAPKRPELRPGTKQILAVEEEVYGTFPAGFGDNGPDEEGGEGEHGDSEDPRCSKSPERDMTGKDVSAKEAGKATTTGTEGSTGKGGKGSAGREAQTASMEEAESMPTREAGFPMEGIVMDLSPSDIRILADDASRLLEHDATRMLEHDATRMLEDDATRMLQDDPFMNPLAPTAALSDEDLLALLSADIALNLGDDRVRLRCLLRHRALQPSSIPQVYPDKAGVSPSAHTMSSSHGLALSPLSPHTQPFALSPPHSLGSPSDLSPSQIEELWRELGSVEIPDLGPDGASSVPNGTHIPNARTRAHGVRSANGHVTRDANGRHVPTSHGGVRRPGFNAGLHTTDDLFGLTSHLSTTQVAGSMFGF